jgi:hypothetical protein
MKLKRLARKVGKFVTNGVDRLNGKRKLKQQYNQSLEQLNADEELMLNKLHSNLQNERNKLAQNRNAAQVAKQHEIKRYTEETAIFPIQLELDKEQSERDRAFQLQSKRSR